MELKGKEIIYRPGVTIATELSLLALFFSAGFFPLLKSHFYKHPTSFFSILILQAGVMTYLLSLAVRRSTCLVITDFGIETRVLNKKRLEVSWDQIRNIKRKSFPVKTWDLITSSGKIISLAPTYEIKKIMETINSHKSLFKPEEISEAENSSSRFSALFISLTIFVTIVISFGNAINSIVLLPVLLTDKRYEPITVLMDLGLDINKIHLRQKTPILIYAVYNRLEEGVVFCLKHGADVNQVNSGKTALHIAVERESPRIVEILMQAGANPQILDANGKTAIDLARDTGNLEILDILKRKT